MAGKVLFAIVGKDVRIQRWCSAAIFAAAFAAIFVTILAASVFIIILGAGKAVLQAQIDCSSMARCASTKQPVPLQSSLCLYKVACASTKQPVPL
jgi:hypothetical protein